MLLQLASQRSTKLSEANMFGEKKVSGEGNLVALHHLWLFNGNYPGA